MMVTRTPPPLGPEAGVTEMMNGAPDGIEVVVVVPARVVVVVDIVVVVAAVVEVVVVPPGRVVVVEVLVTVVVVTSIFMRMLSARTLETFCARSLNSTKTMARPLSVASFQSRTVR
jgi:hypothetical protein